MPKTKKWLPIAVLAGAVLLALVIGLSFANRKTKVTRADLLSDFSLNATFRLDDWEVKGTVSKTAERYTFSLTEPETIAGMEFIYYGENVTVNYQGLAVSLADDSLLLSSLSGSVIQSVNHALLGSNVAINGDANQYTVTGKIENRDYELTVDGQTGLPTQLKVPDLKLECDFEAIPNESAA